MQVGELFARLGLQTDEYDKGIDAAKKGLDGIEDKAKGSGSRMGGFLSNAFAFATGGLVLKGVEMVGGALVDMFSGAMEDARGTQLLMAATDQVIASMGNSAGVSSQHVADFAASLSDAGGKSLFGDDQIQASTNMLLTFGNIKGEVLDLATTLTVDMGQALKKTPEQMSVMVGKLLNSADAMSAAKKMGVSFTDEQIAMGKAMFEAGDVAGYQKLVLEELNKEFGGQAQAAATAAGGMVQFKARMGEMAEGIAAQALPLLDQLGSFAANVLAPALETIVGGALTYLSGTAIPALTAAWVSLQPAFALVMGWFQQTGGGAGGLGGTLGFLGDAWAGLQAVINAIIPPIRSLILSAFGIVQDFLKAHSTEIAAILKAAWQAISLLVQVAVALVKATILPAFQAIAGFISARKTEIVAVLSAAWTIISSVINIALAIITGVLKTAMAVINGDWAGAWTAIKEMLVSVWNSIRTLLGGVVDLVKADLALAWAVIKTVAGGAWDGIKTAITSPFSAVGSAIDGTISSLKGALSGAWDSIKDGAKSAWDGIANVVGTAFSAVTGKIEGVIKKVKDAINAIIKGFNAVSEAVGGPTIPKLATGTKFFKGGMAMVGELGPELVYLPRGSQVVPHRETERTLNGGGSGGGQQTVNNYNLTAQYGYQPERSLRDDVRMFQLLGGAL